jgi:L-seryl-tRNA(Ser) seleniumtransferase
MRKSAGKTSPATGVTTGLQKIPSLDALLNRPRLAGLTSRVPRQLVVEIGREVLAAVRHELSNGRSKRAVPPDSGELETKITSEVERLLSPSLRPVINATGVILHTNLGRAPLAPSVVERIREAATQYSNLEYDLDSGARGKRDAHTSKLIARLAGAEAAIVVNNNAAAVYLVLAALARGGEAIVSRGELIEIGDGFRIPDIMAESGAILREVGTTNRTRVADYERAINERTRLVLRVHRSNFRVVGFAAQPSLRELADLCRRAGVPLYEDLGSGCLVDLSAFGIEEPVVRESFAAGAQIVSFSGDKLLGGPQAGIIAGSKDLIARVRRHPMFRALRVDKLTIAALEASLLECMRAPHTQTGVPAVRMICAPLEEISRRCDEAIRAVRALQDPARLHVKQIELDSVEVTSVLGGGSTPGQSIASRAIAIRSSVHSATQLEERLRKGPKGIPVIARVEKERVLLDLRTVFPHQQALLIESILAAIAS